MKKEKKLLKYDLACGQNKNPDGFIGVDIRGKPDIKYDLNKYPWKFAKSDTVDEIFCSHYIEHTEDLIKFMDECYRILKTGGKMMVIAPYYSSIRAWQDPTHKRVISECSFLYFNKQWRETNKLDHYGIKCDYDFAYGYAIDSSWVGRNDEARTFAIKHYWNVVNDIQVNLTKK